MQLNEDFALQHPSSPSAPHLRGCVVSRSAPAALLGMAVFAACLFGIHTRPVGFLATIWPANAVMLGILLRRPDTASRAGWMAAAAAYVAADLMSGSSLMKALLLNGANLFGVAAAYFVYAGCSQDMIRLRQPSSALYLFLAAGVGSAAAGLTGAIVNPILFDGGMWEGWYFWSTTEFVNYIVILPVVLTASFPESTDQILLSVKRGLKHWSKLAPAAALALSCATAAFAGGVGAIGFSAPALLWCGLSYSLSQTTLLTMAFSFWTLMAMSSGLFPGAPELDDKTGMSLARLGVSLVALAPIMLASVMASRGELLARLRHMASHDPLTGAANRYTFQERVDDLLAQKPRYLAAMMLDIDHFKAVNDTYGHAAGDETLVAFAQRVKGCLRETDLFSRMGGEEFAVILADCTPTEALKVAERIRAAVAETPARLKDGRKLAVTVSIGLACGPLDSEAAVGRLLTEADGALYQAKAAGRNRVRMVD